MQQLAAFKSVYLLPFKCTKITIVIIFQFKLLHRRLATNAFLKKVGLKQSDLCTLCKTETESLIHLFWSCGALFFGKCNNRFLACESTSVKTWETLWLRGSTGSVTGN